MPTPDTTAGLRAFYEQGYGLSGAAAARAEAWRALGARGKADHVLALLPHDADRPVRLLDIGCGDGSVLEQVRDRRPAWVLAGVEVAEQPAAIARDRVPEAQIDSYDGERLPHADDAFDVAVLSHVLEHVLDPVATLREAARVAPAVVVEVPLEANLSARRPSKREGAEAIGHLHRFSRTTVRSLAAAAGLQVRADLTDPLPRAVHRFGATTAGGRLRADVKWAARRALHAMPAHAGERVMTVHYACACERARPASASS